MDNLLSIQMMAEDPQRNVHRNYELTIGQDLFGDWSLTIRYGRVGANGTYRVSGSPDPLTIRKLLNVKLQRRNTSSKRIGCDYRTVNLSAAEGVDVGWWIPDLAMPIAV